MVCGVGWRSGTASAASGGRGVAGVQVVVGVMKWATGLWSLAWWTWVSGLCNDPVLSLTLDCDAAVASIEVTALLGATGGLAVRLCRQFIYRITENQAEASWVRNNTYPDRITNTAVEVLPTTRYIGAAIEGPGATVEVAILGSAARSLSKEEHRQSTVERIPGGLDGKTWNGEGSAPVTYR